MEHVSVVLRVHFAGTVELQPPPDKSAPSALWMERLASLLQPMNQSGGSSGSTAFRCCLLGSLAEVGSHLWQHQVLWMLLRPPPSESSGAEGDAKHVAVPFAELMDVSADFSSGRYVKETMLEDEGFEGSGQVIVGLSLETIAEGVGLPEAAQRPSLLEAFVLTLEPTSHCASLVAKAAAAVGSAAVTSSVASGFGSGLRIRIGGVDQPLTGSTIVRQVLVLVTSWAEVPQALYELDICVQVPLPPPADNVEVPVELSSLISAVRADGGSDVCSAVLTSSPLRSLGEGFVFEAIVRAVRWAGPAKPLAPGRSKDTEVFVEGLNTDCRKWRVSVEIKSLRMTGSTANAFVAYSYEPFQQARSFRTNPPTLVRKNSTVYLPHAFSSYTLAACTESLRAQLEEPLRVEVWHRDIYRKDDVLGVADVSIGSLFDNPLQHSDNMPTMVRGFRVLDQVVSVISTSDPTSQRRIGALRLVVFLEDLGPCGVSSVDQRPQAVLPSGEVLVDTENEHGGRGGYHSESARTEVGEHSAPRTVMQDAHSSAPRSGEAAAHSGLEALQALRSGPTYMAAYELELWRRAEEEKFRAYLTDQEAIQRERLEEEYRQRELQRAKEFRQKQLDLKELEAKARKRLHELQQREIALSAEEVRVATLREETRRRADGAIQDCEDAAKRQVLEAQQTLHFERSRCKLLDARVAELEEDVGLLRQRVRTAEADADEERRRSEEKPSAQVLQELAQLRLELQDEKRRGEALAASRDHFKQKVEELCRRLLPSGPAVVTPVSAVAAAPVTPNPVQAACGFGRSEDPGINESLRKIKNDLALLATEWSPPKVVHVTPVAAAITAAADTSASATRQYLEWLENQRRELLESGLYRDDDPALVALASRIAAASARLRAESGTL